MDYDTYCHRFKFVWDMNSDMAFTVTDLWLLAKAIALLPATVAASALHRLEWTAVFFEIDCGTGQGIGGAIASLILWPWLLAIFVKLLTPGTNPG